MPENPPHGCERMLQAISSEDDIIRYSDRYRRYGIVIHDGTESVLVIQYCPFCGSRLPEPLDDKWFDLFYAMEEDLEPYDLNVPVEMRDGTWWRRRGL
ncbi:MAG: hypothetical protein U0821_08605 [Chloroflexota bacterium]